MGTLVRFRPTFEIHTPASQFGAAPTRRILHLPPAEVLPGLPRGLQRQDASDYLLSRTYAKVLGDSLPRRDVLLKLAATLAFAAVPMRPARAVPLAAIGIVSAAIGAAAIRVFNATFGTFEAKNDDDVQKRGYVMITVKDNNSEQIEGSITARYSFPANVQVKIAFTNGPAATTKGEKTLEVAAEENSEEDEFESV